MLHFLISRVGLLLRGPIPVVLGAFALLAGCSEPSQQGANAESEPSMTRAVKAELAKERLPGAKLVRRKCATCHYLDRSLTKVGPPLKGVYGRAPTIAGVPFKVWNEQSLDQWLKDPTAIKPGTMMAIPGIKSDRDRQAIIAYLKQL